MFGAEIGEAMQGAGRALGQAANFLQEREEQDAARWAQRTAAEFGTAQAQARIESMQNAERGGVGTIDRWTKQFDEQSRSLLEQAPTERSRQRLEEALIRIKGSNTERLMVFEHEARLDATVRDLQATQNAFINQVTVDPSLYGEAREQALAALDEAPIRADKREQLKTAAEQNLLLARGQGLIDGAETTQEAEAILASVQGDEWYKSNLDPKQYSSLLQLAERKVARQQAADLRAQAEWEKSQTAKRNVEYSTLLVRMARGEDVADEIDAYRQKWNADTDPDAAAKWASLAVKWEGVNDAASRAAREAADDTAALAAVDQALFSNDVAMDPATKAHRDAVDAHFANFTAGLGDASNEEYIERVVGYVAQVGIVPTALKTTLRAANLATASTDKVVGAAEMLDRISKLNPAVLAANNLDGEAVSFLTQVGSYIESGSMSPDEAIQAARDLRNVAKPVREDRRSMFGKFLKDSPSESFLEEKLDDGIFSSVSVPPEAVAAFDRMVKDEFERNGDFEAAREAAWRSMQRRWGRTASVSGKQFAPDPPELHYGLPHLSVEENANWILEQARRDLLSGATTSEGFEPGDLSLVPHLRARGPNGKPAYAITYRDQDGRWRTTAEAWVPDYTLTDRFQEEKRQRALQVEAARAERNRDRGEGPQRVQNVFGGTGPEPNVFGNR